MLTCRELTELTTDYLERRMPLRDWLRVRVHIAICRGCRTYLAQMKQTIRLLGLLPPEAPPPHARVELLASFRNTHSNTQSPRDITRAGDSATWAR
ncbi:MAG: zf-HC2 domain-containing protein [Acidobacteria bacterium]|nr:zf-HC2 domain-containing protein [Acidobacteriota bacterium]